MSLELFQEVVMPQMKMNKSPRVNWKSIIKNKNTGSGVSLTEWCAKCQNAGLSALDAFNLLLIEYPDINQELQRRAWIGVCARYGEHKTHQKKGIV